MPKSSIACVDASLTVPFVAGRRNSAVEGLWERWRDERTGLVAPRLIRYEVVNGIHRLQHTGAISKDAAWEGIRTLLELPFTLYDDDHLHERAVRIASDFSLAAAYDAHYLALAHHLECEFWTADKRLFNSVHHKLPWVRLLSG
jgi:predicted nucleic acid-binding protein